MSAHCPRQPGRRTWPSHLATGRRLLHRSCQKQGRQAGHAASGRRALTRAWRRAHQRAVATKRPTTLASWATATATTRMRRSSTKTAATARKASAWMSMKPPMTMVGTPTLRSPRCAGPTGTRESMHPASPTHQARQQLRWGWLARLRARVDGDEGAVATRGRATRHRVEQGRHQVTREVPE